MTRGAFGGRCAVTAAMAVLALTGCSAIVMPEASEPSPDEQQVSAPATGAAAGTGTNSYSNSATDPEAENGAGSTDTPGWEGVVETTRSGVAHLTVVGCDPEVFGTGSGFLIAPDLVVTAAHVVEGATTTAAAVDEELRDARVLGLDAAADVALLQLDEPVEGHVFSWAEDEVAVGSEVAALGFPLGGGFSIVTGVLSNLEGDDAGHEWLQFSAPVNPGNSGGATVTQNGEVIGVVSFRIEESISGRPVSGIGYSVSHTTARPLVESWLEMPDPPDEPECGTDAEPYLLRIETDLSDPDVLVAAQTVSLHGEAINSGAHESAFAMFTPRMQEAMGSFEEWSSDLLTSYWTELTLTGHAITENGIELRMTLRTAQSTEFGPFGLTCSDWDMTYTLVWDEEPQQYLIDEVRAESDPIGCTE